MLLSLVRAASSLAPVATHATALGRCSRRGPSPGADGSIVAGVNDVPGEPTTDTEPTTIAPSTAGPIGEPMVDLDRIARDFDGVEAALRRLDEGTYWRDEITGDEIPDTVLADDPTARRADPA
jgi:hypothetical protein